MGHCQFIEVFMHEEVLFQAIMNKVMLWTFQYKNWDRWF